MITTRGMTRLVVAVSVLALAGGCAPVARNRTAVARGAAPTTGPAAPFDREGMSARLKAALIDPKDMLPVGIAAAPKDEWNTLQPAARFCQVHIGDETYPHLAHSRTWDQSDATVINDVHGWGGRPGSTVVADIRRFAGQCRTWAEQYNDGTSVTYDLLDEVDPGAVHGTDGSYARCEKRTWNDGTVNQVCTAYLSRGDLLSAVQVHAADIPTARAKLLRLVPLAARYLAAA